MFYEDFIFLYILYSHAELKLFQWRFNKISHWRVWLNICVYTFSKLFVSSCQFTVTVSSIYTVYMQSTVCWQTQLKTDSFTMRKL